jgi:hypothetical protein
MAHHWEYLLPSPYAYDQDVDWANISSVNLVDIKITRGDDALDRLRI